MNIGIITQPIKANYGGVLQNFALQQVLIKMGHTPITYDGEIFIYKDKYTDFKISLKTLIKKLLGKRVEYDSPSYRDFIGQRMKTFVNAHITKTPVLKSDRDYYRAMKIYPVDAFIVGSDQVWRPAYNQQTALGRSFLDFAKEKKNLIRLTYAASFGTDIWEFSESQTRLYANLIKKFDAISVREDTAINLCKEYFDVDATHVLDPTMFLDADDYIRVANNPLDAPKHVFSYVLDMDEEKMQFINSIAHSLSLPVKLMETDIRDGRPLEERIQPSVEEWLQGFINAEFIVCDSFHGMVFSIIFNKPFIVLANESRGMSRFKSLLSTFNLSDRMISKPYKSKLDLKNIDWSFVNNQRKNLQRQSLLFLTSNLNKQ